MGYKISVKNEILRQIFLKSYKQTGLIRFKINTFPIDYVKKSISPHITTLNEAVKLIPTIKFGIKSSGIHFLTIIQDTILLL